MRDNREIPLARVIPLAQVVAVKELQVGVDENLPVAKPLSMPISDDDKRSILNLEMFGHRSGRKSRDTNGLTQDNEIINNCIFGLDEELYAYQKSIVQGESWDNSQTRRDQVRNIQKGMINLNQYFHAFQRSQSEESFIIFIYYIKLFKKYIETTKENIKEEYRGSTTKKLFSDYRYSRVLYILSVYTYDNAFLLNNYSHPTPVDTVVSRMEV